MPLITSAVFLCPNQNVLRTGVERKQQQVASVADGGNICHKGGGGAVDDFGVGM